MYILMSQLQRETFNIFINSLKKFNTFIDVIKTKYILKIVTFSYEQDQILLFFVNLHSIRIGRI